ncbi:two-component system sensor histidine kinase NtrB [Desulfolutivibrio sp.]|uniref:two-component system sensor histidine kinase NtrB n=1 Tax=Desulfolutivibrio sp. TaxID=2773296 RepID=UPI002F969A08
MPTPRRVIEENILQSIPVGLVVIDRGGRIAAASPVAGALLGISREPLKGALWREVLPDTPGSAEFAALVRQGTDEGVSTRQRELAYVTPDGRVLRLIVNVSCVRRSGRMVGVVCIFEDVTELHQARERETSVLREKNRLQHDIIESLGNLALSVAHQIRNPTAAIGGFSRKLRAVMLEHGLSTEYPDIIFSEALRLEGIVGTVVRLASIQRPKPMFSPLLPLVERVTAVIGRVAAQSGRTVEWDIQVEEGDCFMDQGLVDLVLTEILRNAVEFSNPGVVPVRLLARPEGHSWRIAVSDAGPGIPDHSLPFVFDPFFTTKARGAGIGLTIARKIVMEHGGELSLHSPGQGGVTVSLRLPMQDAAAGGSPGAPGALLGDGLDACLLTTKARHAGVNIVGLSAVDAVREIQAAEGFEPCFGRGRFDICGQDGCLFRADCMKLKRVEAPCRITYVGHPGRAERDADSGVASCLRAQDAP